MSAGSKVDEIIENLKETIKKGNANKIIIKNKEGKQVASFPVNAGVVGGIIGIAAAPWAVIAGIIGTIGFGFKISVEEKDGSVVDVYEDVYDEDDDK